MSRKKLIRRHLDTLFAAFHSVSEDSLRQRYVDLMRRLSRKFRYRLPREMKRSFCKHCKTAFRHGENCRVRLRKNMVVSTCFACKRYTKVRYK